VRNSFIDSLSDKIDIQLVFAQQIHIRATDLQENEIIQRSREYLQSTNRSFFDILWARVRDKSALIRTLEGHTSSVYSVAVTPDGTKIVSGSDDYTIKIWDLASAGGRLLNTLKGHTSTLTSIAITPDGTKIVSGSDDKTIKVWDLNNGLNIFASKFDSPISSIAISNHRNFLVFGDIMGSVYMMNM
jgi:WD40 repeat protein